MDPGPVLRTPSVRFTVLEGQGWRRLEREQGWGDGCIGQDTCVCKRQKNLIPVYLEKKTKQNLETLPKPVIERLRAATESRDSVKSLCLRLFPSLSSAFFYVGFIFLLALFLL